MSSTTDDTPPQVWTWNKANGGRFANINRPIAGPTHEKELPVGRHPFQLYSLGTPNGVKVTVMFEELLEAGHTGAEYDAWPIRIGEGEQFGSGFVAVNPNSKIPALLDRSGPTPVRVFESGAILLHLAEKFGAFLPTGAARADGQPDAGRAVEPAARAARGERFRDADAGQAGGGLGAPHPAICLPPPQSGGGRCLSAARTSRRQARSTHIATPMPPPMQSVARPFFAPRRRIS
jgi:hypothetical protein